MPAEALAVHRLTAEFLADKPLFGAVADEFLAFVGDAPLVAHNVGFDIAFLNAELTRVGKPPIVIERVIDGASIPADTIRSTTCARAIALIDPPQQIRARRSARLTCLEPILVLHGFASSSPIPLPSHRVDSECRQL
jgi:DNA polymerase III epsilon subunit-like protein